MCFSVRDPLFSDVHLTRNIVQEVIEIGICCRSFGVTVLRYERRVDVKDINVCSKVNTV